jgi:hypothetical protein
MLSRVDVVSHPDASLATNRSTLTDLEEAMESCSGLLRFRIRFLEKRTVVESRLYLLGQTFGRQVSPNVDLVKSRHRVIIRAMRLFIRIDTFVQDSMTLRMTTRALQLQGEITDSRHGRRSTIDDRRSTIA